MPSASASSRPDGVAEVHLSYATILFFAAIALGALLYIVLNQPFTMMLNFAGNETTSQAAADGQRHVRQIWGALPLVFLMLSAFGIIVAAVRESEYP